MSENKITRNKAAYLKLLAAGVIIGVVIYANRNADNKANPKGYADSIKQVKYNDSINLTKVLGDPKMVTKFAVKSVIDTFEIPLNKVDSALFADYVKELMSQPYVTERMTKLSQLGKDTLNKYRERIMKDLVSEINRAYSVKLNILNGKLKHNLEAYPEYKRFINHWNTTVEKEGYGKLFSEKYVPKKDTVKSKPVKKTTPKARNHLR
jgi:hypothetical protein